MTNTTKHKDKTMTLGLEKLRRLLEARGAKTLVTITHRMEEIDSAITPSTYFCGRADDDTPPTGDDYNLLWDALIDELSAEVEAER